ncbi:thiamine phosphate synthase [Parabacteroides sp. OttesenSCG-928-G21]|nr:thiamine phosphate synthase [Parabacteroides sp. OttesenSCG-928-G21]
MPAVDLRLYLVTDRSLSLGRSLPEVVESAVRGGVTLVQLREKEADSRDFYQLALALKQLLRPYHVPLIINDRLDIALAVDADGIHIGQSDLPYPVVRQLLGKEKIIGLSVESLSDAALANQWDVDYIAISPVYATPTKTDTAPALGLEGVRAIKELSVHPIVGIGGITQDNAADIIRAGADGIAIVSGIMSAPDPEKAAREFRNRIDKTQELYLTDYR